MESRPELVIQERSSIRKAKFKGKNGPNLVKERPSTRKVRPKEKDGQSMRRQVFAMTKSLIKHHISKMLPVTKRTRTHRMIEDEV